MNLGEAFVREAERRKDDDWIRELGIVARFAMQPWDLGEVTVSIEDDYGSARKIWIEFSRLPGYPFRFMYDQWLAMQAYDPRAYLVDSMREPLFKHLRYRPCLPVEDHIILGED